MCKLFAISSTAKLTKRKLNAMLEIVNKLYGATQRDGFGFSLQCEKRRYTERYTQPNNYQGVGVLRDTIRVVDKFFTKEYEGKHQTPSWELKDFSGPLIVHGRTSTGTVEIKNTHPFTKNEWTLAHNGVVAWHGRRLETETTCDSEHLLNCYAMGNGTEEFESLSGWAAWVAINPNGKLVVGRDKVTPLHLSYSQHLQAYIIATKAEDLKLITAAMRLNCGTILTIQDNSEITFSKSGTGVDGIIHKGLSEKGIGMMYDKANSALGCNVKAATREQIIGQNQPYLRSWMSKNEESRLISSETEQDAEIDEAVKIWEQHNFHSK